ncbi:LacI family transcriptional regulator [Paenibacillus alginolyticus]|uniref:LacI family DNA-binding transcriptional regulator n=1 Tax=Paenibacillus alginolyticus TaxID=59839 RepID=UPI000407C412|nr:LacI family DNA-binding transcriptional regulator [Paenibacillus alginolyticus]MCY9665812.1 LacI family transcriptional regulator [Paenibacillus alginolyticus]
MKTTIYDVAKTAGVSVSTVSKVLNNTGSIGEKTKLKILDTIRKLEYQPNVVASARKRLQTIGFMMPSIANPFMAEIARVIEDYGRQHGFSLIICSTDNDPEREKEYISILREKYIDGIIIGTGLLNDKSIKKIIESNIPVVMLARDVPSLAVDAVFVDDFLGGFQAASYLIELGHEKIAMITEDLKISPARKRVEGYRKALEEAGIKYDEKLVIQNNVTYNDGMLASEQLLKVPSPPTAIFASTEALAIGAIKRVRELGLRLPEDISIVGFDNTMFGQMFDPQITTIAQPIYDMGQKVMELLIEEINEPKKVKQRIVMTPELVVGGTTAKKK